MTTRDTLNNEALIQEMLRDSQKAEPPGEMVKNPIIHRGDASQPAPMTVKEMSDAGWVWLWNTETLDRVAVLYYRVPQLLRQRRPDGSFRWTTNELKDKPYRGSIKCMLHPDNPDRQHYNEMGLPVCKKENITSPHQLVMHMAKKHKMEYAAIKKEIEDTEKEEERQLRLALLKEQRMARKAHKGA